MPLSGAVSLFWWCLDRLFEDKRIAVGFVMGWLVLCLALIAEAGFFQTEFMTFGPSDHTIFMGMKIDTWKKWWLITVFVFFNTTINDFMSDAIVPWILNTIMDHKCRYTPYPKRTCLFIAQSWTVYQNVMSVISISVAASQADLILIRLVSDLFVNNYTTNKFMRYKEHSLDKYMELETRSGVDPHTKQSDDLDGGGGSSRGLNPDAHRHTEELVVAEASRT